MRDECLTGCKIISGWIWLIRIALTIFFLFMSILVSACGPSHHKIDLDEGYAIRAKMKIEVSEVLNKSGKALEVQAETLFKQALEGELAYAGMLWSADSGSKLILTCKILDYKKGDPIKRSLIPGWGATVLKSQCDLVAQGRIIWNVEANRSVDGWGLVRGMLSVDAWASIFKKVAKDIVSDIKHCPQ